MAEPSHHTWAVSGPPGPMRPAWAGSGAAGLPEFQEQQLLGSWTVDPHSCPEGCALGIRPDRDGGGVGSPGGGQNMARSRQSGRQLGTLLPFSASGFSSGH